MESLDEVDDDSYVQKKKKLEPIRQAASQKRRSTARVDLSFYMPEDKRQKHSQPDDAAENNQGNRNQRKQRGYSISNSARPVTEAPSAIKATATAKPAPRNRREMSSAIETNISTEIIANGKDWKQVCYCCAVDRISFTIIIILIT
jgi:hypothetical protein